MKIELIVKLLVEALLVPATTYGYGEPMCWKGEACITGKVTSSGELFDTSLPTVALHVPQGIKLNTFEVCFMHLKKKKPVWLRVNDRKGAPGLDFSPAAVYALGGTPSPTWSSVSLEVCGIRSDAKVPTRRHN